MVVQYGFVTLFVVAFPLTPFFALINNVLELHIDAVKLCFGFQRPYPHPCESIGQWEVFMSLQSTISVVTCIAIIVFTTDLFCSFSLFFKVSLFVCSEHALLGAKAAVSSAADAGSEWVMELSNRHANIANKVFKGAIVDEDSDEDPDAEVREPAAHVPPPPHIPHARRGNSPRFPVCTVAQDLVLIIHDNAETLSTVLLKERDPTSGEEFFTMKPSETAQGREGREGKAVRSIRSQGVHEALENSAAHASITRMIANATTQNALAVRDSSPAQEARVLV